MTSSCSEPSLFSGRWYVRVLAMLYQQRGARFVVMKQALAVSADSLSRCLKDLIAFGQVQRNPGYGHPLRPEYILTPTGEAVAAHCSKFDEYAESLGVREVVYRKWSVPILLVLIQDVDRFNDIKLALGITPRALTQTLARLVAAGLVTSVAGYAATISGREVATKAGALVLPDR